MEVLVTFSNLGKYGRLGNQLFQIASTIGVATKNGARYVFPHWRYSKYFERRLARVSNKEELELYEETTLLYQDIRLQSSTDLVGYFQSEKYFKHCSDLIRHTFTLKSGYRNYVSRKYGDVLRGSCSVHVRRGDYLTAHTHVVQDLQYYEKAFAYFDSRTKFVVCSDDVQWCKKHFSGEEFIFIEGELDIIDLHVMSRCSHNIIANSSFSWWSAWLNDNATKRVLAPMSWFPGTRPSTAGGPGHRKICDLLPETWITI